MTDLIRHQLECGILMLCCGTASGLVYQLFSELRKARAGSFAAEFLLELVPMLCIGQCITAFLYYGSWGKIALQDAVCFFAGVWLWRNVYGKEGYAASGVRKESPGAEHQCSTGSTEKKERKEDRGGRN